MIRFFKIGLQSKKTKHPLGDTTIFFYVEAENKKLAFESALELATEKGESLDLYKKPFVDVEYMTEQEYLDAQPAIVIPTTENKGAEIQPLFNEDEEKGVTDQDLRFAVALVIVYGLADEYTEEAKAEAQEFADAPFSADPEMAKDWGKLYELMTCYMPRIYTQIQPLDLLKMINHLDHHLHNKSANMGTIEEIAHDFITASLGLKFDPVATVAVEPEQTPVEPEKVAPVADIEADLYSNMLPPCIEELPEPKKVDNTLVELNARIDALSVGEGFYIDGLSNANYHASNAYSKSSLDIVNRDPSLLEWAKNAPEDESKKDGLIFGSAFHTMVLEPHLFDSEYIVMPQLNLRTNEGKAKKAEIEADAKAKNKALLTAEQMEQLKLMRGSVFAHPTAKKLFDNGIAERSFFYRWSPNIVVRIRPDWITEFNGLDFIVDLKSSGDASKFGRSIEDYRYHVQDAFYSNIYNACTGKAPVFAFCVTGKMIELGKYPTRMITLDAHDKDAGESAFIQNLTTIENCITSDIWGGFETVTRPRYARNNDLFTGE